MHRIATLAVLLACMHLSLSAAVSAKRDVQAEGDGERFWCSQDIVANKTAIVRKILKEAVKLIEIVDYLFGERPYYDQYTIAGLKENGECEPIVLPPLPFPALNKGLQSTANVFWNLSHLLQMYHTLWRVMELHEGYALESESAKLDMLEIVISRFSNQVERYLQANRCSCTGADCITHQDINEASIQVLLQRQFSPAGCSRKLLLGKIIANIRTEVRATYKTLQHHRPLFQFTPWPVCATLAANPINC